MRPEMGMCVYKRSLKNDLQGTCVFSCVCRHLHAQAPPVHYWPTAEARHFPVFIKTWPIKFYLQSIIRTPQINQRQLNQCFPGSVPGPHGPHGHSIFPASLIHSVLLWSHTMHPLACSRLLDSTVPRSWLWSAAYGGSLLRGIGFDFINLPVEVRDREMNAMFHLILSGHVGHQSRAFRNLCHHVDMMGGSNSAYTGSLWEECNMCLSFLLFWPVAVRDSCGKQWPNWRESDTHSEATPLVFHMHSHPTTRTHTYICGDTKQSEWWVCYWQGHRDNKLLSHWQLH